LQQAFTGVAYLAHRAGVPTVPVAVYGQERIVESCRRLRRAPVTVEIGTPIPAPSGEATAEVLRAHTDRVMLAIARLLPPEYRGRYADAVDAANDSVKEIA
jgi:1-acyl-sn-glycerol-3-phosphate acyltransferase